MTETFSLIPVADIYTDFSEKFGIPRQSGLVPELRAKIVFRKEYRQKEALRGIEGFSHLWLLWGFSKAPATAYRPTVRPPRLGGNLRMGVFATRSPCRPNPIGLSSVTLLSVEETENEGTVLWVGGADLLNGTPIYDIKPYLAFTDSHPEAKGGFADGVKEENLKVSDPNRRLQVFQEEEQKAVVSILSQDPRPHYHEDPQRVYGMCYAGKEIRFTVDKDQLTVVEVTPALCPNGSDKA